jgi:hypothetical protein
VPTVPGAGGLPAIVGHRAHGGIAFSGTDSIVHWHVNGNESLLPANRFDGREKIAEGSVAAMRSAELVGRGAFRVIVFFSHEQGDHA